ncbi:MAG: hypothetical protein M3032_06590 [Verrucomicrobiota bacterium]|nr:hypothetical protein [Verrucomicrobiota bacterium]
MSKPSEKVTSADEKDEVELKDLQAEGDNVAGGQPLPSTITGGGGQFDIGTTDKSES